MKASLFDLMVVEDTLIGSLNISEGGAIFKYPPEVRKQVRDRLAAQVGTYTLTITPDTDSNEVQK